MAVWLCLGDIYICFLVDQFGVLLGNGSYGKVHKAIQVNTGKEVAIKSMDIEINEKRNVAKKEESIMRKLKGSSPYLIDLLDSFEEVCKYIYIYIYYHL
jgi:serine/threonine protein kinase